MNSCVLIRWIGLLCLGGAMTRPVFAEEFADEPLMSEEVWGDADWLTMTDDSELPVERFKKGFFQKFQLSGGYLGSGSRDNLGIGNVEALVALGVPLGSFKNILAVAPKFRVDFLDGPSPFDLPDQVYDTGVNFVWRKQLSDRWGVMAVATPAVRSDFVATEKTVRVFALGLATWQWIPDKLEISFGAVYLDRNDISLLPAVGLRARPNPRWLIDLMFPRPRISYRISKDGPRGEVWGYLGGALGGNTWAVLRDGINDEMTIRGYQLLLGIETVYQGGNGAFLEIGSAFNREVEFEVADEKYEFGAGFLVQAGLAY
ncbi:MAG: DUF6268 family outer membrane beta-barrel protein [Pirellulaceae bacterium]|nr:DUF6268 family outer membrane beta-barrel protein [Pirellulaceae bacterium]